MKEPFYVLSSEGVVHEVLVARKFCSLHNLNEGMLSSVKHGRIEQTKGWKKANQAQINEYIAAHPQQT